MLLIKFLRPGFEPRTISARSLIMTTIINNIITKVTSPRKIWVLKKMWYKDTIMITDLGYSSPNKTR